MKKISNILLPVDSAADCRTIFLLKSMLLIACWLISINLQSQTNWIGAVSSDWNDPANWTAGVPGQTDVVGVQSPASFDIIISSTTIANVRGIVIQYKKLTIESGGILNIGEGNGSAAFRLDAEVLNQGTINIGQSDAVTGIGLFVLDEFTNDGGVINIDQTSESAIRVQDIDAGFKNQNEGHINIGQNTGSIGFDGINNNLVVTPFINDNATITIDNVGRSGIFTDQPFENINGGIILIGQNGGNIAETGISTEITGTGFKNDNSVIVIDNAVRFGLQVSLGFENINGGIIEIGDGIANIALMVTNSTGFIDNDACSVIRLNKNFDTFNVTNDGLFELNTAAQSFKKGTFDNNGVIVDIQGTLPNTVTNNEVIIAPTTASDCEVINPAFTLASTIDLNIVGVFANPSATVSAGTYTTSSNTFEPDPALSNGMHNLYVKVEDTSNGCSYIAPWNLTTSNCCESPVMCYADSDGDSFGDPASGQMHCESCTGDFVSDNTDCDDLDPDEFPGQTWYIDADGDSYGASFATACERPTDGFLLTELMGDPSGTTFAEGTYTVEYTATDPSDNTETCTFTITVQPDAEVPVPTCTSNMIVFLDVNGSYTIQESDVLAGGTEMKEPSIRGPLKSVMA
ncbi:MAG: HYR domain-containing protein [Bacteroidota bacterium]